MNSLLRKISAPLLAASLCSAAFLHAGDDHSANVVELSASSQAIVNRLTFEQDKLLALAEAIPEDHYGWRPVDDVASVGEVLLHVAQANFSLGHILGAEVPGTVRASTPAADGPKSDLVAFYQKSVAFVQTAAGAATDASLAEEIEMWGNRRPRADFVVIMVGHYHEHTGQMIAYARSNQIVPPWSK